MSAALVTCFPRPELPAIAPRCLALLGVDSAEVVKALGVSGITAVLTRSVDIDVRDLGAELK